MDPTASTSRAAAQVRAMELHPSGFSVGSPGPAACGTTAEWRRDGSMRPNRIAASNPVPQKFERGQFLQTCVRLVQHLDPGTACCNTRDPEQHRADPENGSGPADAAAGGVGTRRRDRGNLMSHPGGQRLDSPMERPDQTYRMKEQTV